MHLEMLMYQVVSESTPKGKTCRACFSALSVVNFCCKDRKEISYLLGGIAPFLGYNAQELYTVGTKPLCLPVGIVTLHCTLLRQS